MYDISMYKRIYRYLSGFALLAYLMEIRLRSDNYSSERVRYYLRTNAVTGESLHFGRSDLESYHSKLVSNSCDLERAVRLAYLIG